MMLAPLLATMLLSPAQQGKPMPARSAAPPPAQAVQQNGMPAMRRYPGVSDAGNAILADALAAPDPQLAAIVRQQRQIRDQLMAAAMEPTVDVDRVAGLLRQREDLQGQLRQRGDDRLVTAIRQLPIADRGPFLRALVTPAPTPPR